MVLKVFRVDSNCMCQFLPGLVEFGEELPALVGELVVLSGRTFHPLVAEQFHVLPTC